jgi:hypothetical protein
MPLGIEDSVKTKIESAVAGIPISGGTPVDDARKQALAVFGKRIGVIGVGVVLDVDFAAGIEAMEHVAELAGVAGQVVLEVTAPGPVAATVEQDCTDDAGILQGNEVSIVGAGTKAEEDEGVDVELALCLERIYWAAARGVLADNRLQDSASMGKKLSPMKTGP